VRVCHVIIFYALSMKRCRGQQHFLTKTKSKRDKEAEAPKVEKRLLLSLETNNAKVGAGLQRSCSPFMLCSVDNSPML